MERKPFWVRWLMFLRYLWTGMPFEQFNVRYLNRNILTLCALRKDQRLRAGCTGKLSLFPRHLWDRFVRLGGLWRRTRDAVEMSLGGFCYQIRSPLERAKLQKLKEKKESYLHRAIARLEEGKVKVSPVVQAQLRQFQETTTLQLRLLKQMEKAISRVSETEEDREIAQAIALDIMPILATRGYSGAYWMRDRQYQRLGLFKPFDEEMNAPNNPSGDQCRGPLSMRLTRSGLRVGEGCFREVAAYLVDKALHLGIVPPTRYAAFVSAYFGGFQRLYSGGDRPKRRMGSFQKYIAEGRPILMKQEWEELPLALLQPLFILDIIIGNNDRHANNVLLQGEKIWAIDHALSFFDRPTSRHSLCWLKLPQAQEPLTSENRERLASLSVERLKKCLKKYCFLSPKELGLMEERIILLRQGVTPRDIFGGSR